MPEIPSTAVRRPIPPSSWPSQRIDAWSWDAPFGYTAERWQETRDPSIIWEGHQAGRDRGYCQIEKLGNLDRLPATGFTVVCFPVKIKDASAGWTRAVAVFDE